MEDKKSSKGKNITRIVVFTLLILYSTLYIMQALGYYEYSNNKNNTLTNEAIKRFENDIKMGKNVKASDYRNKKNDYNNKISRSGLAISNLIENIFDNAMGFVFKEISKAIDD